MADPTLLVLHTLSTRTADVTFLILQSVHTPSPPITDVVILILSLSHHTAQLSDCILQMRPSMYCTLSLFMPQM